MAAAGGSKRSPWWLHPWVGAARHGAAQRSAAQRCGAVASGGPPGSMPPPGGANPRRCLREGGWSAKTVTAPHLRRSFLSGAAPERRTGRQ
eukprot:gene12840-biopygen18519